MLTTRVVRRPTPAEQRLVLDALAAEGADEATRLDDHLVTDLAHGPRDGFVAVIATDGAHPVVGYAQASCGNDGYLVGAVAFSDCPGDAATIRVTVMSALLAELPADAAITWWPSDVDEPLAHSLGLAPGRRLLQMRVPLPIAATTDVATRPFRVGNDESEWLEVNNAAFHWHGEQGGWDLATLHQREREPWFSPAGFLLHERDGRLAGFCWTKLHDPEPDGEVDGEIYVIAVHPDFHGLGLGRALTVAGLQHLHHAGATRGMLYVDAANTTAVRLYETLGFRTSHTMQAFQRTPEGTHQ